ncbi:Fc.00g056340.m01.CDS01 [Cosmosporella sp. VM-42]
MKNSTCNHWLWVSGGNQPSVSNSGRLKRLTAALDPQATCSSMVVLIGCRKPVNLIRKPERQLGGLRLYLDRGAEEHEHLLLGTAALPCARSRNRFRCCLPEAETFMTGSISALELESVVYSRLLPPFTDIFCFYSYGLSDLAKIARWISTWSFQENDGWKPSLIVVLGDKHWHQSNAATVAEELFTTSIRRLTSQPLSAFFYDASFLQVPKSDSFDKLRSHLRQHTSAVRQRRRDAGLLFSVEHFNILFERAFESASRPHQFDLISSARQDIPVSKHLADHLGDFMNQLSSAKDLLSFASPTIASSILLDHYLPGMHLFKPADVFNRLYRDACLRASKATITKDRTDGILLPSALTDSVLKNLVAFFDRIREGESAVSIHRSVLAAQSNRWLSIKSKKSCLSCMTQTPQYKIPCGHWICEICLQVFGTSTAEDPLFFVLEHCLLDGQEAHLGARVRPPTAGHSILCIDGGGVRGIIPPAILGQIQDRLDLPIPIQELFTMAYGVSAGALIILALFFNGWSVERCAVEFEQLAKVAFSPSPAICLLGLSWIRSIVSDSLYSGKDIETALKKAFGDKALTDMSYATRIGTKIGVPAATIVEPSTFLFTNYNGVGKERSGYTVLRDSEHVKAWEVGRSSSAAPLYFPPKYVSGLGTFQDAGVLENNPILVALSEFAAINGNAKPDLVLNIGTGSTPDVPIKDQRPRFIMDSWLVRLKRAYMSLMQGKKNWHAANASKGIRRRNGMYRLDITLQQPPALDDTTTMAMLTSLVQRDTLTLKAVPEIVSHLFATLFYFELDSLPKRSGSKFSVSGQILCIRKGNDPALPKILERLRKSTVLINGKPVSCVTDTDAHSNILQEVVFTTGNSILIEIMEGGSRHAFPISGSPHNIAKLISGGRMTAAFGTRTHMKRPSSETCSRPSKRRKRCIACSSYL